MARRPGVSVEVERSGTLQPVDRIIFAGANALPAAYQAAAYLASRTPKAPGIGLIEVHVWPGERFDHECRGAHISVTYRDADARAYMERTVLQAANDGARHCANWMKLNPPTETADGKA